MAIKLPHQEPRGSGNQRESFYDEPQKVAKLRHQNLVIVHEVGHTDQGVPYVIMEYVEGPSLGERLKTEHWSVEDTATLVIALAEAAHHAHRHGIVHRDMKPANILLDAERSPRIADFGLAVDDTIRLEARGPVSGTLPYMAPEQVRGQTPQFDGRVDIWALGVILYEMLTGRRPFQGKTFKELSDNILHQDPKPPRQIDDTIPAELERITLKCLAKQPADRYTTAADLARDLRRWQQPRQRIVPPLVAVATVVVALVVWLASWRPGNTPTGTPGPPAPPLSGAIDVLVWNPEDPSRRGLSISEPHTLPLLPQDQVRVEAHLNRPAYVYLVWIDSEGIALPVYPWRPGRWEEHSIGESMVRQVSLPKVADQGWPMQGPSGMETLILLSRETPLPSDVDLSYLLAGLPNQPMQDPRALVWFTNGQVVDETEDPQRGPNFFDPPSDRRPDPADPEAHPAEAGTPLHAHSRSQFCAPRGRSMKRSWLPCCLLCALILGDSLGAEPAPSTDAPTLTGEQQEAIRSAERMQ